ncbi:hypothetical protein [Rhodoplanes serenus]|uniref:hypothetical protein n=1 Tax=Rhodoplanes serenus TaxID=200615 RepID=UPI000DAC2B56|nr:hypothetical protein [Rhodoplanes serenus]RAI33726.1 hypothetical protein CH340_11290 [Rhodoplanes serenus]
MTDRSPTSFAAQATAVELAAANQRGHVENLRSLVAKGKRPQTDVDVAVLHLPALEDAAATLRRAADRAAAKSGDQA